MDHKPSVSINVAGVCARVRLLIQWVGMRLRMCERIDYPIKKIRPLCLYRGPYARCGPYVALALKLIVGEGTTRPNSLAIAIDAWRITIAAEQSARASA